LGELTALPQTPIPALEVEEARKEGKERERKKKGKDGREREGEIKKRACRGRKWSPMGPIF